MGLGMLGEELAIVGEQVRNIEGWADWLTWRWQGRVQMSAGPFVSVKDVY